MQVNVTTLLVLTSLFIGISNSLPRTAYVKMIDIWSIVNLMVPFFAIITQTYLNQLYNDINDKDDAEFFHVSNTLGRRSNNVSNRTTMATILKKQERRTRLKLHIKIMKVIVRFVLPGFYISFCIIYALIGMNL